MNTSFSVPGLRAVHRRMLFAILPLASGVGLIVYVLAGISLLLGFGVAAALGVLAAWAVWRRAAPDFRTAIKRRARVGAWAGVVATVAYDLGRYGLVSLAPLHFWPFHVFSKFGALLIGSAAPPALVFAVGTLYHYVNGIGFGLAYVFLARRPTIWNGLLWAAVLELLMVSIYPSWLDLHAIMAEFLTVSLVGHTLYGLTLGGLAQRGLRAEGSDPDAAQR